MALDLEGYRDYQPTSRDHIKRPLKLFTGGKVGYDKILSYFSEWYQSCVELYNRYKRFGLPFSGGWAEQPGYIIEILETFEAVIEMHDRSRNDS